MAGLIYLFAKLAVGALMMAITVVIHAIMCDFIFRFIENHARSLAAKFKKYGK